MSDEVIGITRDKRDNWFFCVDKEVFRDSTLSTTAKCVFAVLCMIAGFGHRGDIFNDEAVAKSASMSVSELLTAYKELEQREVISRCPFTGNNGEQLSDIWLLGYHAPCYNEEDA